MRRLLGLLVPLVLLVPGCSNPGARYRAELEGMVREFVPRERTARLEFQAQMRSRLAAGDYASLERIADSLRTTRATFGDHSYALYEFISAFHPGGTPRAKDVEAWRESIREIEAWRSAAPASALPCVVLAQTDAELAWKARGHGVAFTVADSGWVGFRAAMNDARDALDEAASKRTRQLEWYLVRARVALGLGFPSEESERIFQGAIACDSTCALAYWQRADYLLPRWYGREGEWEAWLDHAVAPLSPEQGDRVYASVCDEMARWHRNVFAETKASWPRTRRGMALLLEDHPKSQALTQAFAFDAFAAGDIRVAHHLFGLTGPRCDTEVWRSKRGFVAAWVWVQARGANVNATAAAAH